MNTLPTANKAFEMTNDTQVNISEGYHNALPSYESQLAEKVIEAVNNGIFSVTCEIKFCNSIHKNKFCSHVRDKFGYFVTLPSHEDSWKFITVSWDHF